MARLFYGQFQGGGERTIQQAARTRRAQIAGVRMHAVQPLCSTCQTTADEILDVTRELPAARGTGARVRSVSPWQMACLRLGTACPTRCRLLIDWKWPQGTIRRNPAASRHFRAGLISRAARRAALGSRED